ncbi:hypothetical protein AGLY_001164 [Aphis glycines]|uniref:Uncharacterized protein n=1 Tax=Aphis glycines TaxID=307491 RepID=A0A6G0U915_APHGL|nr:hypothetical protein AGLY_001164 [Aphis glycines]
MLANWSTLPYVSNLVLAHIRALGSGSPASHSTGWYTCTRSGSAARNTDTADRDRTNFSNRSTSSLPQPLMDVSRPPAAARSVAYALTMPNPYCRQYPVSWLTRKWFGDPDARPYTTTGSYSLYTMGKYTVWPRTVFNRTRSNVAAVHSMSTSTKNSRSSGGEPAACTAPACSASALANWPPASGSTVSRASG